jgi:hypothetical protein
MWGLPQPAPGVVPCCAMPCLDMYVFLLCGWHAAADGEQHF